MPSKEEEMNMYTKPGKQREVLREKGLPKKEVGEKKKSETC